MKKILLYLVLLMALSLAGIVAYVSVNGLLKIFTGAGTVGLMFFTAVEVAKVVATSVIHTYGKRIGWFYNILLSLSILIAMAITSMGIYGYLSSSYKDSFAKMENVDSQVELLESKRDGYQDQLVFIVDEKETLNNTIGELSKGLANNVIQYRDPTTGEIITTTSSSTRRALEKQLDNAIIRQSSVNAKADSLSTIIFDLENEILETKLSNDSASELSTLQYLSDITGKSMDEVMKWFILLLIIIGDPMAVLLVIVFNKVVKKDENDAPSDAASDAPKPRIPSEDLFDVMPSTTPMEENPDSMFKLEPIYDAVNDAPSEEPSEIPEEVEEEANKLAEKLNRPVVIREVTPENIDEEQIEEVIEEPIEEVKREPIFC